MVARGICADLNMQFIDVHDVGFGPLQVRCIPVGVRPATVASLVRLAAAVTSTMVEGMES